MAISTIDGLVNALGNSAQQLVINKASIASQAIGIPCSLWRATGTPGQGAIPTTAATCTSALTGAFAFTNPTGGMSSYLGRAMLMCGNAATDIQFHDRLAHMGGLSGIVATAQTAGVDASVVGLDNRRGASDYSDVQWWLEWYTATGGTAVTATITYTNVAGTTGRTTTVALAATRQAGMFLPIIGLGGEFIKSVQSVTLSATTGTQGSFGVTATRALGSVSCPAANSSVVADWAYLGLPKIGNDACIMMVCLPGTTSSGTVYGTGKIIQG